MDNAHQHTSQERRQKLVLKLKPSLRFMTENNKNFTTAAPMLFGQEFAKQATTTVEQVKVMKKLTITTEKRIYWIPPTKLSQLPQGWVHDWLCEIPSMQRKPDRAALQPPRSKQARTKKQLVQNVLNFNKEIINNYCHHTDLSLNIVLPSIKWDIVTNLHAGQIKKLVGNWALFTQDPWV